MPKACHIKGRANLSPAGTDTPKTALRKKKQKIFGFIKKKPYLSSIKHDGGLL